jgi:hypothetical protein
LKAKKHCAGVARLSASREHGFQQDKNAEADCARSNQAQNDLDGRDSHPPPEACIISHPGMAHP